MDTEWAEAMAERTFRRLHKDYTWTQRDQNDENRWVRHDQQKHGMPYAICTVCEYSRKQEG